MILFALFFSVAAQAASSADFLRDLEIFKQRSPLLKSEREQLDANSTATISRFLQFTPSASGVVGRSGQHATADGVSGTAKVYSSYLGANVNWNLFKSGGDFFSWQAAKASQEAQEYQVRNQELKTEVDGAGVIFRRLYLRDVQGAQAESLKLKQESIRIGRDRYKQGKIPLQDVSRMEVDLFQQQTVVRQSELQLAENQAAFRAFFVDDLQTKDWPFGPKQSLSIAEKSQGSLEQRRLDARAESLHDLWKTSRVRHLPSVDLSLQYRETPIQGPSTHTWAGVLELSIPFWSRFEIASDNAQAYATSLRAENEATQNARAEELRREYLRKKISLSQTNFEEARLNLEKSERLYRDMLRSFQLGRLSTNDLFLEQDRRIRTLLVFAESRLAFHESLIEACALWGQSAKDCLR